MELYFNIAQIIISVALTVAILLQLRSSGMGGIFGGSESAVYRTKRGVDRMLFNVTVGLSVTFFIITILNAVIG